MQITKGSTIIQSILDWREAAPPKGKDRQWKVGRSAYELAAA